MRRCFWFALVLPLALPAQAMNKCVDARGRVTFQEAPCPGSVVRGSAAPAAAGAPKTPAKPGAQAAKPPARGAFKPSAPPAQEPGERSEADKRADTDPHYRKQEEAKRQTCARLAKDVMDAQARLHTLQGESRARAQRAISSAQDDYYRRCPR